MDIIKYDFRSKEIRVLEINGEPWFVAKDVCLVLEIHWSGVKTLNQIQEDWKGVGNIPTPGGEQSLAIINEAALFKLAFRSNKPEAEHLTNWVAGEVLPSIRKTGSYGKSQIEHETETEKSLIFLKFVADDLGVNEGSRIQMYKALAPEIGCQSVMKALPDYTEERVTMSLTTLLKREGMKLSARKAFPMLIESGLVEIKFRPSTTKGTKPFKSLTPKGLHYGKNLISSANQKETQPHFYEDRFDELIEFLKIPEAV